MGSVRSDSSLSSEGGLDGGLASSGDGSDFWDSVICASADFDGVSCAAEVTLASSEAGGGDGAGGGACCSGGAGVLVLVLAFLP